MKKAKKKRLRKQIRKEKIRYADSTLKEWSAQVLSELESHPSFLNAETILCYHSLSDEVHTHDFIESWKEKKRIILPVVSDDRLVLRVYEGKENTETGSYGISEPTGEEFTDYDSIDLVIVPGVAFDRAGNRLGRGKGYYDKLLPHLKAYKLGVCFPFQYVDEIPVEPFDICMHEVLCGMQIKNKDLS